MLGQTALPLASGSAAALPLTDHCGLCTLRLVTLQCQWFGLLTHVRAVRATTLRKCNDSVHATVGGYIPIYYSYIYKESIQSETLNYSIDRNYTV